MEPAKIEELSALNIERLRTRVGPEAVARLPDLIETYLKNVPMLLHHDTRPENDASIQRDGFIYSNASLLEQQKKFKGGQTSTPVKLQALWERGLKYEADKCTNWVYFHLHMDDDATLRDGYNFELDDIPEQAWMGFRDPYFLTSENCGDGADLYFLVTFNEKDVYASAHVREAIMCHALDYIGTAMNHVDVAKDFIDRNVWWVNTSESPVTLPEAVKSLGSFSSGREYYLSGMNQYKKTPIDPIGTYLKAPRALDEAIFEHPEFDQMLRTTLKMTYEDMATLGQFTLHDKVDVSNALLKRGQKVDKVSDLIAAASRDTGLEHLKHS